MKIRSKVIGLIVALFVVLAAVQLVVQRQVLLPSFAALERKNARTDMARVNYSVQRELDLIGVTAINWGNWDESYRYMLDRNPDYLVHNLYPAALGNMKVDVLMMIDVDGRYVWSGAYDTDSGKPIDIDLVQRGELPASDPWWPALRAGRSVEGLIGTNRGAMLAALSPVLDGEGRGPNRGAVLMGRLLTAAEVARIGEQSQTKLSVTNLQREGSAALPAGVIMDGSDGFLELPTVTNVYRTLDDVYGRPLVRLRSETPRSISAQGRQTVAYAVIFTIAAGAVVLIVLLMVLNRVIISPLTRITHHAVTIGERDDRPERLNLDREDELGTLAREFERMMDRLLAARRELVDRSFESGIAEMASGTLHNIGNAMTPLAVDIAALQQRLRKAPTDDVHLVIEELDRATDDRERQADLVQFLRLTSQELADLVKNAEGEAATIARQAQAVQDALAEQRNFKRTGPVTEAVSLTELISHSIEIVPDTLRRRMVVENDPSVFAVGAVRLPRTTLQQVLQNLFVNAAEAIRDAGRVCGVLRIAAAIQPGSDGGQLHLRVQDEGVGIAEQDLGRIFERGFSTKSRDTNSGIGLHWCANALNALGGSIRATSEGRGHGACMHVVIPVDQAAQMQLTEVA